MAKVEKVLEIAQIIKKNPNISVNELSELLKMNYRTVYRYIKWVRELAAPAGVKGIRQSDLHDKIDYLTLALSQPQLSLIHESVEVRLQNPEALKESERQILEEAKELISKAIWVKSEAAPVSIKFLFAPTSEKYEGEVSIGFVGKFKLKNPHHMLSSINVNFFNNLIFSPLFTYVKGKPQGLLVKSWDVSDNLLVWTFTLKEGVKFHNGKELTAEDVEFTYRRVADPDYSSPLISTYSFVKSFDAISKYKFQIRLKQQDVALLYTLGVPILPKEVIQKHSQPKIADPKNLLIGSGPFKFDSFSQDQDQDQDDVMILKANENYFERGYPHLEKAILKAYPTSRDLFNAAASREVDVVIFGLGISELEQLGKIIPFQVYPIDMYAYYALLFNLKDRAFNDIRVRKAINHMIDREELLKNQLKGYGSITNGPLSSSSWAYNEHLPPVKYDIDLAKSLLMEAGWQEWKTHWKKGNEKLKMEVAVAKEVPDLARLAIGLKWQLSRLKVKVNIRHIDSSELAPNKFQSVLLPINFGGDPGNALWRFWHSGSRINLASYHNPVVDELLDLGKRAVSPGVRKAIYDEVQELIVENYPAAFLCTGVYFLGSNCILQNADEYLSFPCFFTSIKSWIIKKGDKQ